MMIEYVPPVYRKNLKIRVVHGRIQKNRAEVKWPQARLERIHRGNFREGIPPSPFAPSRELIDKKRRGRTIFNPEAFLDCYIETIRNSREANQRLNELKPFLVSLGVILWGHYPEPDVIENILRNGYRFWTEIKQDLEPRDKRGLLSFLRMEI